MANMIQSTGWANDVMTAKKAITDGLYLGLYTAPAGALTPAILDAGLVPAGGATLTEVTAAQLNGYARIQLTGGVVASSAGQGTLTYGSQTFSFTGAGTGTTILGWFVAVGNVLTAGAVKLAQQETPVTPPGVANTYTVGPFTITDQAIP